MTLTLQTMNRYILLALAPFIGVLIFLLFADTSIQVKPIEGGSTSNSAISVSAQAASLTGQLEEAHQTALIVGQAIHKFVKLYAASNHTMWEIVSVAAVQAERPAKIYDRRIARRIGSPVRRIQTKNIDLQLFRVNEKNYDGYAMKVHLKSDKAMRLVLGKDKIGRSETTLAAVKRTGAIAGVNAGGFADSRTGRYPLSTTILNGKYVYGFEPSFENLFFVGLNKSRKLIGGKFDQQANLDRLQPVFGVSFVPILIKNSRMQQIPRKWLTSPHRAARTVIANFKDNQLLILVVNGADSRGNKGATLPELQNKLAHYGVIDAYNLDGGGSSTLVFDGKVWNDPSDGQMRPLATNFVFFQ